METLVFLFAMGAKSLLMMWYVTVPILIIFFLSSWWCIKRFSTIQRKATLALGLTVVFLFPLAWISMVVLYRLGKIDFP